MARFARLVAPNYPHHITQRGVRSMDIFADDLTKTIGETHCRYTRKKITEGIRGYLFQGRFGSCVLDQQHLLATGRYVERNPVTAGMVESPVDYPRLSARFNYEVINLKMIVELWQKSQTQHSVLLYCSH